ncbi:FecR domain-containing protein [Parabacteroides sp. OttesenSCG-928-G06]|nr:FecR domain-containing protein [Parabacteroides sp. OttesenSCG-928-G06]
MQDLITKYFEGKLNPEEKEQLFARVRTDEVWQKEFIAFQNLRGLTTWLPAADDQANAIGKLLVFKETRRKEERKKYNLFRQLLRYAAVVALSVCSTWTAFHYSSQQAMPEEIIPEVVYEEFTAPVGQRALVRLQDGTTVWLNAQTTLRYPDCFSKTERRVELDGEAYFDVRQNAEIPFIVATEKLEVKVTGTRFNVFAYKGNNQFSTSLLDGSVMVYQPGKEENGMTLAPNEQATLDGNRLVKTTFSSTDFLLWKEGIYSFDNVPFRDIVRKLELYYDVKIFIRDKSLEDFPFTGKFRQRDGVESVLKRLQKIRNFKYVKDEELNTITIK